MLLLLGNHASAPIVPVVNSAVVNIPAQSLSAAVDGKTVKISIPAYQITVTVS
jgi:hypothetical protein